MILRRQSLIRPGVIVAIAAARCRRRLPRVGRRFAHDIPSSVTRVGVRQAGSGTELARRHPRAARGDARRELSAPRPRLPRPRARDAAACMTRRRSGSPTTSSSTRTTSPLGDAQDRRDARLAAVGPLVRDLSTAPSRTSSAAPLDTATELDVEAGDARRRARLSDRVGPLALLDRPGAGAPRRPHDDGAPVRSGQRRRARVRVHRRSWAGAPRSALVSGGARLRRSSGSSTFSTASTTCCSCFCLVIPFRRIRPLIAIITSFTVAHSITLIASALGFRARRALVSAADRSADRAVDRVHGAREHRRRASSSDAG